MLKNLCLLPVIALLFTYSQALCQTGNSPFTSQGIGDIVDLGLTHNQGMGGTGISNGSFWFLNNINPALLPYNSFTTFSAGFVGENKTLENAETSEKNGSGNLGYLVTAFPIKPGRLTTSVGLMPYSNVGYESESLVNIPNAPNGEQALRVVEGSGGFNQFFWSNGYAINKRFFVGLKAAYIFGNIKKDESFVLPTVSNFTSGFNQRLSTSDFIFTGGIAYNKDSIFNNRIQFKAGLTYDFGSKLNAKNFSRLELRTADIPIDGDTLNRNDAGSLSIPHAIGVGFSLNNGFKWTVALDVKYQPWSDYRNFAGGNDDLGDQVRIGFGGEFTPDPSSVTSYLKRITYRVGLAYENTPYQIVGPDGSFTQVNDFGINLGWTLPISRVSNLDFALQYGTRGNVDDTLIQEQYLNFYFGVTINDQPFKKRKYY
ncbi:hypothetical protein FNH22_04560 [Fulvivirga sp. M361]|uniref:hypothetical protein n=1 Tax=Fulvivirga sp. M361 TaxID=2594266 RepID=UPI001179C477|nr:hypothetical protein [Fulvivirga sp. M361]TRX61333.1 hypothetical protein FNH22_04560 [Fulvivirga sp. M361]